VITDKYKQKIKSLGSQAAVADTVRKLKTAQSKKNTSSSKSYSEEPAKRKSTKRTVQRQNNMFKRF